MTAMVMADTVDPVMDEQLAMFVVESHRRSHPSAGAVPSASPANGTGDEEAEDDNTAIINDKVRSASWAELTRGLP